MQGLAALLGSHSPLSTKVSVILRGDLISHIMDSWRKKKKKRIERVWKKKERLPWKFSSELAFTVMGKNECKLNCSQAGSNRRQLLLSQVTCFIYKDM